jgi:hypothetical protein
MTPVEGVQVIEPEAPRAEPPKPSFLEVKSPMVGTDYSQAEPGSKPYVTVGTRIAKRQVLCIIEAMKIMNEIESEFDGVVKEVCVQDAHPVRAMVDSGAIGLGLAALSDDGKPRYNKGIAGQVVSQGMPVAALSPMELARWVGEQIR